MDIDYLTGRIIESAYYRYVFGKKLKSKETKMKKLFFKMFEKQKKLNDLTYPAWKEELTLVDWQSAVLVEAGELLESFGYKWWKKQTKDIDNVKVELIDILHFLLSDLHYYSKSVQFEAANNFIKGFTETPDDDYLFKRALLDMAAGTKNIVWQFYNLGSLFSYVDMDFNEVYKAYFVKNILNEFRQKYGYKKGTYKKIWKIDLGEGLKEYEDNQVVFEIANKIPLEKLDEILMTEIENIYKEV